MMIPTQRYKPKYGNKKVQVDGITFDSKHEANRYLELKLLEKANLISDLELQKKFELIPTQRDDKGKVIERSANYIADFYYYDKTLNKYICEDSKGYRNDLYILKKKLMRYVYGIEIIET